MADYTGFGPWAPGGFVSGADARSDHYRTQHDPLTELNAVAYHDAIDVDHAPEWYEGSVFAYVPLDFPAHLGARAERLHAVGALVSEPEPQTPHWPALNAIVANAYSQLNGLWQRIADEQRLYNDW